MRQRLMLAILKALSWLPLPLNHPVGALIGWAMWKLPTRMKRFARINIERCLPELSERDRQRLLRRPRRPQLQFLLSGPMMARAPRR